jgi:methyl-accepting chemotaxis protein
MIKLNRIGNKLGLAGLAGMLLSAGMLVNQMMSEATVTAANQMAARQQNIAQKTLEADASLRRMQLSVRDVRLARDATGLQRNLASLADGKASLDKSLDSAIETAKRPENKERLVKIKGLAESYYTAAVELAGHQKTGLELIGKRSESAALWVKSMDAINAAIKEAPNRSEIERTLFELDSYFNGVRAAVWRFAGTGDEAQKDVVVKRNASIAAALQRLRPMSADKAFATGVDTLAMAVKTFNEINDKTLQTEAVKTDYVTNKTLPVAEEALKLMHVAEETAVKLAAEARDSADAELASANRNSIMLAIAVVAVLAGSIIFTFMGVARPLTRLNGALGRMANGETGIEIPGAKRGDEVGDIAKTVVVIAQNAEEKARQEAIAKAKEDEIAAARRKQEMVKLADDFEGAVGEIIETVSSAATELEASASTLKATAERSQALTITVAASSEEASTNVQSVASASEELSSSVNEISRQVQDSARIAAEAVRQAEQTNGRISQLSQSANRIGDVVELINTIAGQTNLLALNATIEAARAGEAGRGFAVVASEVKALAEQTAKATGEISQQISAMQAETANSVTAIAEISRTIDQMSEIASAIASAVEEQGAATQEISRNVQQAAQGTMQVSSSITDVQHGATETGTASSQVLGAAQSLSTDSNRLKMAVDRFLDTVRAA